MQNYLHQIDLDPVLFHLWGPLQIRWYSILYVGAFILARFWMCRLAREERFKFTTENIEQFILWILIGAVVGSRIAYCIFYDPQSLLANPLYLFQTYKGGLSFHGGLMGVIVAAIVFSRKKKIPFWNLADAMALATPSGLAMGRLGNFINGELYGKVSYVPWAIIFKDGGSEPRHPSQLYELFLEGFVLFFVMWFLKKRLHRDGQLTFVFLIGYSLCRFMVEFFREPDAQLGYPFLAMSMGQILSLVMLLLSGIAGYFVLKQQPANGVHRAKKRKK